MPSYQQVEALVIKTVTSLSEDFEIKMTPSLNGETPLYGNDGPLDSLALVNLISDLEDLVSEEYDSIITLADEKAMSARNSPFLTIQTLSQAVIDRMES
jgi:acyl carrier protein